MKDGMLVLSVQKQASIAGGNFTNMKVTSFELRGGSFEFESGTFLQNEAPDIKAR